MIWMGQDATYSTDSCCNFTDTEFRYIVTNGPEQDGQTIAKINETDGGEIK